MQPSEELKDLELQIDKIGQELIPFCDTLRASADAISTGSLSHVIALAERIANITTDLKAVTIALAGPEAEIPVTLSDLHKLLHSVKTEAQQKLSLELAKHNANQTIANMRNLRLFDGTRGTMFKVLDEHGAYLESQLRLSTDCASIEQSLEPAISLLNLAAHHSELSFEQTTALSEVVTAKFGLGMAIMAAQGKLTLNSVDKSLLHITMLSRDSIDQTAEIAAQQCISSATAVPVSAPHDPILDNSELSAPEPLQDPVVETPMRSELSSPEPLQDPVVETPMRSELSSLEAPQEPVIEPVKNSQLSSLEPPRLPVVETVRGSELNSFEPPQQSAHLNAPSVAVMDTELSTDVSVPAADDSAHISSDFALQLLSNLTDENLQLDFIYSLIAEDKTSLALYLVRNFFTQEKNDIGSMTPTWLLQLILFAPYLQNDHASDLFDHMFSEVIHQELLLPTLSNGDNRELSLLALAGALRPALIAPSLGTSAILHQLRFEGLIHLPSYIFTIAKFGDARQALDPHTLKRMRTKAEKDKAIEQLILRVNDWWARARDAEMIYGGTKKVWLHWLKAGEHIYSLLQPIRENNTAQLQQQTNIYKLLADISNLDYEIRKTEKAISTMSTGRTTGKALSRIREYVNQALNFADEWLDLNNESSSDDNRFAKIQAERIRTELQGKHDKVLAELQIYSSTTESFRVRLAAKAAVRAIGEIEKLFDPDEAMILDVEPTTQQVIQRDLFLVPPINLSNLEQSQPADLLSQILGFVSANPSLDFLFAFRHRCSLYDHVATRIALDFAASFSNPSLPIEDLIVERKRSIEAARDVLQHSVNKTQNEVENALSLGLLSENDRLAYAAEIQTIDSTEDRTEDFQSQLERLHRISSEIQERRRTNVQSITLSLNNLNPLPSSADRQRITDLLDKGDVLTANEYIDLLRREKTLPEFNDEQDVFADFFPEKCSAIEKVLDTSFPIMKTIRESQDFCGIDITKLEKAQLDRGLDLIKHWFNAKSAGSIGDFEAEQLLKLIGFSVRKVNKTDQSRPQRQWFDVNTEPVRDKETCPVSRYGSVADGHYKLLCVWGRPSEEELLSFVGETTTAAPVLVFFFGRLTMAQNQRRKLAQLCRERKRTFIVFDDILMVYQVGTPGLRLPTLFKCSLPFTYVEPFVTTAGVVPPEIFYGRTNEQRSILDPFGSCFIYGGRQLGKTALLRKVEREFHELSKGQVALWLDLKAHGLGLNKQIDELGSVLKTELRKYYVIPSDTPPRLEQVIQQVRLWLDEKKQRRILLLLDEADRFLEVDAEIENGESFRCTTLLKRLMDETSRRFKVVFAGLHNVQRTTRLQNHPLAHFGEPMCIGPLLDNGEWREAFALIQNPLRATGYYIQDDLVTRILSQTNYYPSLIQLYCQELLKHIVSKQHLAKFKSTACPPYLLSSEIVTGAYQSQNLRKNIRERLDVTLQLDTRYEVIAYAMALATLTESMSVVQLGFSTQWVQDQVMEWWAAGFKKKSHDDIKALLSEMVGLGILRESSPGRYALRSPNVAVMIGTTAEIEEALVRDREPPAEYEPSSFRSMFRDKHGKPDFSRRSPLTAQQEGEIVARRSGIHIIFGSNASGIDDVPSFLEQISGVDYIEMVDSSINLQSLVRQLQKIAARQDSSNRLCVIPSSVAVTFGWFDKLNQTLSQLQLTASNLKVIYLADPGATWELVDSHNDTFPVWLNKIILRPWQDAAVRQWLEDCAIVNADAAFRNDIMNFTGNWPLVLNDFRNEYKTKKHLPVRECTEFLKDSTQIKKYIKAFGLDLDGGQIQSTLSDICLLDGTTEEELIQVIDTKQPIFITKVIRWAEHLFLVEKSTAGTVQVNPFVSTIIRQES